MLALETLQLPKLLRSNPPEGLLVRLQFSLGIRRAEVGRLGVDETFGLVPRLDSECETH